APHGLLRAPQAGVAMTILVTGGCGFIGSNFVLDWAARTDEPIVNLDKLTYAGKARHLAALNGQIRYKFVHAGIEDTDAVGRVLDAGDIRAVVNFAAETHVDRSIDDPEPFVATNIAGTMRLLEAVRAYWLGLSGPARQNFRFLQVSTDEVYGAL